MNSQSGAPALSPQAVEALAAAITKTIGSEPAKIFRRTALDATDDSENYAAAAVVAFLLAEPLPASERVDRVAALIKMARPA